jgi:hypothetical protein
MSDQQEVARDIMKLAETVLEGVDHINVRMQEGNVLDTSYLFEDIVSALTSIFSSLQPIIPHLCENKLITLSEQLILSMGDMTAGYEKKDDAMISQALQGLFPVFRTWQNELDRCLRLYTAS